MITHYQCVIIETGDNSFKIALPGEIRVKYTKYGPRPLPKSMRDQSYFSIQTPMKSFETMEEFLNAVSKILDRLLNDGKKMSLDQVRAGIEKDSGFRVGAIEKTVKYPEKSDDIFKDLDDIFERSKI
jgi:hypothetical protein